MALSDEITKVRRLIQDENSTLFSDNVLMTIYNTVIQGHVNPFLIARDSYYALANASITLVDGTETYDLASDCLAPVRFWVDGNTYFLRQIERPGERIKWTSTSGTPNRYYLIAGQVGFRDAIPGTGTVYYDYWSAPTRFTAVTDDMPYNGLLNELINQMVVFYAENMNEAQADIDQAMAQIMENKAAVFIGSAGTEPHAVRDTGEFTLWEN